MKKLNIFISPLLLIPLIIYINNYNKKPIIIKNKNMTQEINTSITNQSFIKIKNGKILTKDKQLDTTKLGTKKITINIENNYHKKFKYTYNITIKDTQKPEILNTKDQITTKDTPIDLLKDIKVKDNSNEQINPEVIGDYNFYKEGTYNLIYQAKDSSNNITKIPFKLIVNKKPVPKTQTTTFTNIKTQEGFPYYIKVNKTNNVVIIYADKDGYYNQVVKVFKVSPGVNTPTGTFKTKAKYQWKELEGKVWGQYSTRITGHYLFHSVPYYKHNKYTLEYNEYNMLGIKRSMGCIRLTVIDAKWIYDNCPIGTTVEIYNGSLNGITIPQTPKIDINDPRRGWDPTDPDPNNPWK